MKIQLDIQASSFCTQKNDFITDNFYKSHYQKIIRFLSPLALQLEDAEDIAADTLYKLTQKQYIYEVNKIEGWLFKVARNSAIDKILSEKVRKKNQNCFKEREIENSRNCSKDADNTTDESRLHSVLHLVQTLTPRQQQIIRLMFLKGKSSLEIAELLHVKKQTVLNTKTDALTSLFSKMSAKLVPGAVYQQKRKKRAIGPIRIAAKNKNLMVKNVRSGKIIFLPLTWGNSVKSDRFYRMIVPPIYSVSLSDFPN